MREVNERSTFGVRKKAIHNSGVSLAEEILTFDKVLIK